MYFTPYVHSMPKRRIHFRLALIIYWFISLHSCCCFVHILRCSLIWIRQSLQASIAFTHRHVQVQIVFSVLFFIILDYFSLFFNSTCPVNSIAKEIFWTEIYRGRLFFRTEIYRGRHFLGPVGLEGRHKKV